MLIASMKHLLSLLMYSQERVLPPVCSQETYFLICPYDPARSSTVFSAGKIVDDLH